MVENIIGTTLDSAITLCQNLVHTRHCRSVGYGQKSLIYHCKTCSKTEGACLCALCFNGSDHKGHDYSITEASNFTCDCGDESQWKEEGFCPLHGKGFTGNLRLLLPDKYREFPEKMTQCIDVYVFELIRNNITEIEKIGDIILKLMQVDLFYLIIAELLTKQFSPSSSVLVEQLHQQKITYHEFLYEKMFTTPKPPTTLMRILTSFQTDLTLIHFDHEIIYKLFIYSLEFSQHSLNEVFCNTFIFRSYKDNNNKYLFFNKERYLQFISITQSVLDGYVSQNTTTTMQQVQNVYDFLWAVFLYCPNEIQDAPFDKSCVIKTAVFLATLSNRFETLPCSKVHEQQNQSRQEVLKKIYCLYLITSRLIPNINIQYLYAAYNEVLAILIQHIQKYFKEVPSIVLDGDSIDVRTHQTNQPCSPMGFILPFFLSIYLRSIKEGINPLIPKEDAKLILQYCLLSIKFRQDYENKVYIYNDDTVLLFYWYYVSGTNLRTILSDYTMVRLLIPIVGVEYFIKESCVMFEMIEYSQSIKHYSIHKINNKKEIVVNYLTLLIQIDRRFELVNDMSDEDMLKLMISHHIISGNTRPNEISKKVIIRNFNTYDLFDVVYDKDSKQLRKHYLEEIDPLTPLLKLSEKEVLINTCLLQPQSPLPHRYQFNSLRKDEPHKILFQSVLIYSLIKDIIELRLEDISPLIIMLILECNDVVEELNKTITIGRYILSEPNHEIERLIISDKEMVQINEYMKYFGREMGMKEKELFEMNEVVKEIGNGFEVEYENYKKEQRKNIKRHKDKQAQIKQRMINQQNKILLKDKQELQELVKEEEEICVICQQKKNDIVGFFTCFSENKKVETIRKMNNGIKVKCNVNGCQHTVHYSCYQHYKRNVCPICKYQINHFLPHQNEFKKEESTIIEGKETTRKEVLRNCIFNEFYDEKSKEIDILENVIDCLYGTIVSLQCSSELNYLYKETDRQIIISLLELARFIFYETELFQDIHQMHYDIEDYYQQCKNPLKIYLFSLVSQSNTMERIAWISQARNCACIAKQLGLCHDEFVCIDDDIHYQNIILPTNIQKQLQECLSIKQLTEQLTCVLNDQIKLLNEIIHIKEINVSIGVYEMMGFIDELSFNSLPDIKQPIFDFKLQKYFKDFVGQFAEQKCSVCNELPKEYMKCSYCLSCGAFICDNQECFILHKLKKESPDLLYIYLRNGRICVHINSTLTASSCIYFNKYTEPFEQSQLKHSEFILNELKLQEFLQHYIRGDVIENPMFK
ncbi:hypothetical protein ENUP19_0071G0034 [Entamoeba nuttalli]|uniref:E3 ubiquitin-protein ligase n=2 Tax=Entamoeba nuttalli TaxID=412467 RepID=K2HFE8_ENTNP|nr:zinc finger in N-recognin protein [Entamoeba nuttalli P19]EKE41559.1 zinc finger in N-recognin protein [Entamoeba nuttalli P19]|eukprot:XP_008856107.1 zinc finger in N-recognin protein [Entamoeba nuttalli P19]